MAWSTPGTLIAGEVLTASRWNSDVVDNTQYLYDENLNRVLGRASLTTQFTTSSTHTTYQDEGLSVSITYGASRILRVSWTTRIYAPGGANRLGVKFIRGSTDIVETTSRTGLSTAVAEAFHWSYSFVGPATGATETFKIQIRANESNSSVSSYAEAASPRVFLVEDLGPS